MCEAAINIKGEHFPCDWPTDEDGRHDGWAHSNRAAEVIWRGDVPDPTTVFEALGAISVCWENPAGAGVFESERATAIGDELMMYIKGVAGVAP